MRRNLMWLMSTVSTLVLLFSYKTSLQGPEQPAAGSGSQTTSGQSGSRSGSQSGSRSGSQSGSQTSGRSGTFTGTAAQTQWGPVQVQITVTDGRITAAQALQYPNNNPHDQRINATAIPALNEAAVQAQSADLDGISGATVTSQGYRTSLQSAIDQAKL